MGKSDNAIANTLKFCLQEGNSTRLVKLENRSLMVFQRGLFKLKFECTGERHSTCEKTVVREIFVST